MATLGDAMTMRVRRAFSAVELRDLYRIRHDVFVSQEGDMPPRKDAMIFDAFDSFPNTLNIVALDGDRVVGGIRFVEASAAGLPIESWFEVSAMIPDPAARIVAISLVCLHRSYRGATGIADAMLTAGLAWARSREATHIACAANPEAASFFARHGMRAVGCAELHHDHGLPFVRMVADLGEVADAPPRRASSDYSADSYASAG